MSRPYISIVVPAYNEEKYLKTCLEHVARQHCDIPYEVIVVDNNSNDSTIPIATAHNARVVHEQKKGYVHAVRAGVKAARAPIIALTDADTIVPRRWLATLYSVYNSDNNIVAVGGGFEYYDGPPIIRFIIKVVNRIHPKLMLTSLSGMNMSFRKSAYYKVGGYDPRINVQADAYLGNKLIEYGKVVVLRNNYVYSSARRMRSAGQIVLEVFTRFVNFITLKLTNRTIFNSQVDYR